MNTVPTNMTVADYCAAMDRGEIVVNKEYQRSDKVWPHVARGYLIETILLGFPMPKLSLYQIVDVKSKKTVKEIVDGQQRSMAIRDFMNDLFSLPSNVETEELKGKTYSDLEEDAQRTFLDYSLSMDLFVSANRDEVVEIFRRMNSYTIPLNAEEHRHASFQGRFKWFINRIAMRFKKSFVDMGVFGDKQLVRMADTKLLTEISDAILNGIRTTNRASLDHLYDSREKKFPEEGDLENRLTEAIDEMREWTELHNDKLMRPYLVYSLVLAITHARHPVDTLTQVVPPARVRRFDRAMVVQNLSQLDEALENPEEAGEEFAEFVSACTSKTNTREQRSIRFRWLSKAITSPDFP